MKLARYFARCMPKGWSPFDLRSEARSPNMSTISFAQSATECTDSENMEDDPVNAAAANFAQATPTLAASAALTADPAWAGLVFPPFVCPICDGWLETGWSETGMSDALLVFVSAVITFLSLFLGHPRAFPGIEGACSRVRRRQPPMLVEAKTGNRAFCVLSGNDTGAVRLRGSERFDRMNVYRAIPAHGRLSSRALNERKAQ